MSSILSLLGGGGPQPQSIRVTPPQAGGGPGGGSAGALAALKQAIQNLHTFVEGADDEVDRQTALQCYAKLQSILANEQKEQESALGTTPAHKFMSKQTSRSGY